MNNIQICTRCIYDETTPSISFNEDGVCNYCEMSDGIAEEYKTGTEEGKRAYDKILSKIKHDGRNKKYDCVIGVSGGTDSSFMLHKVKEWGLRPLAVHYDNTWNTAIASQNIKIMLEKLNIDLYTHVVDNEEVDSIFKSFFYASVPDLDVSTDIALKEVLYEAANYAGVRYIFDGHSFMTEGVSALGDIYMDGRYIKSVNKIYGTKKLKTFPNMPFFKFMKWTLIKRIKQVRPYWYLKYSKEEARQILEDKYGWKYYGGHHLENRLTAFLHVVWLPMKFNRDLRNLSLAAKARTGAMPREDALEEYSEPITFEPGLVEYFKKRLNISDTEFDMVINKEGRTYRDFPTYKRLFEILRPFFYVLYKLDLVPKSFYIKYTSKGEI